MKGDLHAGTRAGGWDSPRPGARGRGWTKSPAPPPGVAGDRRPVHPQARGRGWTGPSYLHPRPRSRPEANSPQARGRGWPRKRLPQARGRGWPEANSPQARGRGWWAGPSYLHPRPGSRLAEEEVTPSPGSRLNVGEPRPRAGCGGWGKPYYPFFVLGLPASERFLRQLLSWFLALDSLPTRGMPLPALRSAATADPLA